jgi:glycosyltransferase involved in cell wall biosynthesis
VGMWTQRAARFMRARFAASGTFPPPPKVHERADSEENSGASEESCVEPASRALTPSDDELARGEAGVDAQWYLETYPDVAAVGMDPVSHYLAFGWLEGRDPRPDFSTTDYLAIYDELTKARQNPFIHYLRKRETNGEPDAEGPSQWHALWTKNLFSQRIGDPPPLPTGRFGVPGSRKILFAGHEATRTGAPLILLALMKQFQKLPGAELFLLLDNEGILLEDYNRIAHVLINRNGALYRVLAGRLLRSLADPMPALAICNSASSWQTMRELRRAGISNIVTLIHERVTHYSPEACRTLQLNADRIVFPAHAVKAAAVQAYPEFRDALVASQGLLDPAFGQADRQAARRGVRERLGLTPETRIVFSCGVREPRKGFDLFLQLAARVIPQAPSPVHFVWLGGDERVNEFTRFFYHDLALLGLGGHVSVVPDTADPEPYFLAADAYALTSRDDPFPCVMLEAMACALPVVAFAGAGGAGEVLSEGCGIMVPYLDVDAMTRHVRSILEQPADFAAMGTKAERRVRSAYRFTDYAGQILDLCAELQPGQHFEGARPSAIAGPPVAAERAPLLHFLPERR